MSLLELKNVCYQYEGTERSVLKDINVSFEEGKLYGIMGKSGAGKSTILSLISGLDICTSGSISYQGEDLSSSDRDFYRSNKIGVVFQGYNLLTNTTAIENILLSMKISKYHPENPKEYAYQLLTRVGIDHETANRKILKLSGGEQQRIGIARALAHQPSIIIADEPTGNLDTDTEKMILSILISLAHDENKCVIIVTHSKAVSSNVDELWGLNSGKLSFIKAES